MNFRRLLGNLIRRLSLTAVHRVVRSSNELDRMWKKSVELYPSFRDHFSNPVEDAEAEARIRFLVSAECAFIEQEVAAAIEQHGLCSYADIGDSDGSVRLVMENVFGSERLNTVGINLQPGVVERMESRGLKAICADAIDIGDHGTSYDIVSLFETMEHLPDPIGFLRKIGSVVQNKLILSVPYVRKSRVGLYYTEPTWPSDHPVTIETIHIFELSPADWRKVFRHAGWRVEREAVFKMFPDSGFLKWVLSPYWRYTSFEGFHFVTLVKDETYSSRYGIG